jgi:hypothetical protein
VLEQVMKPKRRLERDSPEDISIWSESLVLRQRIALTTFFHATNVRPRKPFYLQQGASAV